MRKQKKRKQNNRGQLSLGLAAAFTMVIAILGMVLRSGVITREKMKMQQTSDLAALAASDYQRQILNTIRDMNRSIEDDYRKTQIALEALPKPCEKMYQNPFGNMSCEQVETITSRMRGEKVEGEQGSEFGGDGCGCQGFDANVRNILIKGYNRRKAQRSAMILDMIGKGNQAANNVALSTFLIPNNLPLGLQQWADRKFGPSVTKEILKNEYIKGELKNLFTIIEASKDMPLFEPKLEIRPFHYQKSTYYCVRPSVGASFCNAGTSRQTLALTTAKVIRDGDYNTSFITGATYSPAGEDRISKWKMYVNNASSDDKEKFGKPITDLRGKKLSMFQERMPMTVMSIAKPYGGSFPTEGNPVTGGFAGSEFKGAKLVGLADEAQIGKRLPLGGSIEGRDAEGRPTAQHEFYNEDYLH